MTNSLGKGAVAASCIIALLGVTAVFFLGLQSWSRESVFVALLLLSLPLFVAFAERGFKVNFFDHFPLALLAILVVHIQYHIDYVIGVVSKSNRIWVSDSAVPVSLALSVVGILAFVLAYRLNRDGGIRTVNSSIHPVRALEVLMIASLVGFFASANPMYLAGYYGYERVGQVAAYFLQIFRVLFFAVVIVRTRNMKLFGRTDISLAVYLRALGVPVLGALTIYLTSVIIIGDRGPLITYPLCVLGNYFFLTKLHPPAKWSIVAIVVGALFISLLGDIRRYDRDIGIIDRLAMGIHEKTSRFDEQSIFPPTQNLANSIRTLNTVVDFVPSSHPHTWGLFQVKLLLSIVPFGSKIENLVFTDQSYRYSSSTAFTTWIVQGDNPYSGEGTTCIADLYLDFGVIGVLLGMGLYGFLIAFSERVLRSGGLPSVFAHSLAIIYLANAVYIARSPLLADLKFVIWTAAVIYINNSIWRTKAIR